MKGSTSKYLALSALLLLVPACTGNTVNHIALEPAPNDCQVTEARPTHLSTLTYVVCWDHAGRAIGLAGGEGEASIGLPLSILSAGSIVGGAYVLGSEIGGGWTVDVNR